MSYLNGYTENYEYDNNNNVTKLWKKTNSTASATLSYEWVYNAAGLLYKEFDYELNRTTHYEYDADGGLIRTYTIDADGKTILQIEYPQKGSVDSSVRYIIDGVILDELDVTADEENNTTTLTSHAGIVTTTTDDLGRVIGSILQTTEDFALMESYSYLNVVMTPGKADTSSSTYVSTLTMADGTVYGYSYDSIGNITRVTENGVLKLSYQYDGQGQLVREDNAYANATYAFTYDGYGNILSKSTYGYTLPDTELPTTAVSTNTYSYGDPAWPDQLTEYNGTEILYDAIGNPLSYYNGKNFTFTWEGRTLVGAVSGENSFTYTYNSNGIRVKKVANSVVHNYTIDGTKILAETYGDTVLKFYYDENDSPIAFSVNGTMYYYGKNLQGDVVKLYSASGEVIAEYTYDAWGKLLAINDINGNAITDSTNPAVVNPIRYRGYYYDVETGFYYLNSRYYDASTGRFLNADDLAFLGVSGTVLGYNLYGYCENEPVNHCDANGYISAGGLASMFSASAVFNMFMSSLLTNFSRGLAAVSAYVTKLITPIAIKAFWWKPLVAAAIVVAAVAIVVTAVTVTYNAHVKTVAKADAKIRSIVKRNSMPRYWTATVRGSYVDIGRSLTYSQAVKEVKSGRSVFTVTQYEAMNVAYAAGGNKTPEYHTKHEHRIGYYNHYHIYNHANGAHVFYLF